MKKHYYTWKNVEHMATEIVLQMYHDDWKPDYIVGITRGGNVPATIISNMTGVRCEALKVKLRDNEPGEECESNCWMAEDAFAGKKILIVDDINDSGATFNWIKKDWSDSVYKGDQSIWGDNVRFAVLTENFSSEFDGVQYYSDEVNKAEEDVWLVYPWEAVGQIKK